MATLILEALYFFLPAFVANMIPVVTASIPRRIIPNAVIGGNRRWRGESLFGSHKTYRGFILGVCFAILIVYLQKFFYGFASFREISLIPYDYYAPLFLGILFGVGALGGDLLKSFFKRRLKIASGNPWIPFDQIDFVVGGLCAVSLYVTIDWVYVGILLLVTPFLHLGCNVVAYLLGMKKVWW